MSQIKNKLLPRSAVFLTMVLTGCTISWLHPTAPGIQKPAPPPVQTQRAPEVPFETSGVNLVASAAEIESFTRKVSDLMKARNYTGLDTLASELSGGKARFIGGGWKIHSFYLLTSVPMTGDKDADWESHIAFLQEWKKTQPASVAARCSLVSSYIGLPGRPAVTTTLIRCRTPHGLLSRKG